MKSTLQTAAPLELESTEVEKQKARFKARLAIEPSANAALVIGGFDQHLGYLDQNALVQQLSQSIRSLEANGKGQCEAMLYGQALALQAISTNMAQRASLELGKDLDKVERFLRISLKAQNQCRMTVETMAGLKAPRVVVAQQTNIAHGPQQVNNGPANGGDAKEASIRADHIQTGQSKLLEEVYGERLDTGTTSTASGADQAMAPVGPLNGAENV